MRMTLRFEVSDGASGQTRTFLRHVDHDYPRLPMTGEAIVPDEHGHLAPRRVRQVTFNPDGSTVLDLELGAPHDDIEAQVMALTSVGFEEEEPRRLL